MSERKQFRAIKGTRDILPPDSALWNWFEHTAREVFESYNFGEIRLPILEEVELFARSVGFDTDIVSKEMFTLELRAYQEIYDLRGRLTDSVESPLRFTGSSFQFLRAIDSARASDRLGGESGNAVDQLHSAHKELYERIADDRVLAEATERPKTHPEIHDLIRQAQAIAMELRFSREAAALRPEATASVCRAYIEHNMQALPGNQKLYYIGPMFRRERPQKGRYRQFYQIGAEVLGQSDAPAIDAEVLEMLLVFFNRVGLTRTTLYVNSIG